MTDCIRSLSICKELRVKIMGIMALKDCDVPDVGSEVAIATNVNDDKCCQIVTGKDNQ